MTLVTPQESRRRSTFYDEDLGEVVDHSGHGTWANGDLHQIIQDLVEALSPLQAISKGHEVQPLVAALSESVARQQVLRVAARPCLVECLAKSRCRREGTRGD